MFLVFFLIKKVVKPVCFEAVCCAGGHLDLELHFPHCDRLWSEHFNVYSTY